MNAADVDTFMSGLVPGLFYVTIGFLVVIISVVLSCLLVRIFWSTRIKSLVYLAVLDLILLFILVFFYTR